jgi:aryl sulfotransferase
MSDANHMTHMRAELRGRLNAEAAAQGIDPMMEFHGDIHDFFGRWIADAPTMRHIATWWDLRSQPNVLFVHYNDLKADLDREMRRVAAFLNINIPAGRWPAVVDRCTFDRMRAEADKVGNFDRVFEGGAQSFLFKGTNGRWREVLTEAELQRYRHRVEELLAPEAAYWLEHGSYVPDSRP